MSKKEIDHLIYFFEEQILKFKEQSKKTYHKPKVERVHQLRTTISRLRVILWILGSRASTKPLKELKKILGRQRDLDVMAKNAEHYEIDSKLLEKKRMIAHQLTSQWLTKDHRQEILNPLYKLSSKLQKRPELHIERRIFILKCTVNSWLHRTKTEEELHEFRLSLKKLRFTYEALGKPSTTLKKIQDRLGEARDLEELRRHFKHEVQNKPHILQQERILKAQAKELARKILMVLLLILPTPYIFAQSAFPDITPDVYKINTQMEEPPPLPVIILATEGALELKS